jgi:hypothetical protein
VSYRVEVTRPGRQQEFAGHVWFNPKLGMHVATPIEGPWANELIATGSTAKEAMDNLCKALDERDPVGGP